MKKGLYVLLIISSIISLSSQQQGSRKTVKGKITQDAYLPQNKINLRVVMDSGTQKQRIALVNVKGIFTLLVQFYPPLLTNFISYKVSQGLHIIEVFDQKNYYPPVAVFVTPNKQNQFYSYSLITGIGKPIGQKTVAISPSKRYQYIQKKEPFNIMNLIFSGYGMMGFMAIMVLFVIPRMPKVDKEQMQNMMGNNGQQG